MQVFNVVSLVVSHLSEIMGAFLLFALMFRFVAYRSGKRDQMYFDTFARSVEKKIETDNHYDKIEDVEGWLNQFLESVASHLPSRSLRFGESGKKAEGSFREQENRQSFREFADGKKSVIHSVKQQVDTFKTPFPPSYQDLTERVLAQDRRWQYIMGFVPVTMVSRMLDIMPGLFIIGGIFGTFIGITGALPMISQIDMANLEAAAPILNDFVNSVAFSMNTSIAGIVYSVILTILNAMFPISSVREAISKNLENCFESIWFRVHGERISTAEDKMITLLSEINENLKSTNVNKAA